MKQIAIVGAGIAGLATASQLDPDLYEVTIFDKSRGIGGRVSTRRIDDYHFDHGAQYIELTDTAFRFELENWMNKDIVKAWNGELGELQGSKFVTDYFKDNVVYVGNPKMTRIGNYMFETLTSSTMVKQTKIVEVFKKFSEWYLVDAEEDIYGGFDFVVIAIPPPQGIDLLQDFDYLVNILSEVEVSPRWSLLVGLDHKMNVEYDGVFVNNSPIRWMARNNSKPNRPDNESWVIHASVPWTKKQLDNDREGVEKTLYDEFLKVTGFEKFPTTFTQLHLWRYARVDRPLNQNFILDNNRNIALCGDYCMGNNIEAAYLSGYNLGKRLNSLRL